MSSEQTASAKSTEKSERPSLPEGRYGSSHPANRRKRTVRGWRMWVFGAIALAVSITVTLVAYGNLGQAPIEAQRVGFEEKPGNAMEITIDVQRGEPDRPGVCIVRVRDISGAETGRKEIYVAPGEERLSTVIRSIGRPVTADVYGCSYNVPEYLSTT
ncbi:hypothetical protein BAY61_26670 [Prauserella marina]|uniref:Uncharacterized protein n=1 Tax=Prauserella marina TaxID=530584 RepID=A0A222VWA3_9PSEU|nr:DUF4307 domain-containing protein [Prauserella marina]ASR38001.1 hypothetical protein BAY61_26670 [Prauserella marina]PWV73231.1 uncharacterized protein DUF4307 [Prauserella marina]SDD68699.1 protein of unknown function [Prauserella marina]